MGIVVVPRVLGGTLVLTVSPPVTNAVVHVRGGTALTLVRSGIAKAAVRSGTAIVKVREP